MLGSNVHKGVRFLEAADGYKRLMLYQRRIFQIAKGSSKAGRIIHCALL
jgi:hypothetical protein